MSSTLFLEFAFLFYLLYNFSGLLSLVFLRTLSYLFHTREGAPGGVGGGGERREVVVKINPRPVSFPIGLVPLYTPALS